MWSILPDQIRTCSAKISKKFAVRRRRSLLTYTFFLHFASKSASVSNALIFIAEIKAAVPFRGVALAHQQLLATEFAEELRRHKPADWMWHETKGGQLLFFKEGAAPTPHTLIGCASQMEAALRKVGSEYESRRICACAACAGVMEMRLNFAAYFGPVGFIRIIDSMIPSGEGLVKAKGWLEMLREARGKMAISGDLPGLDQISPGQIHSELPEALAISLPPIPESPLPKPPQSTSLPAPSFYTEVPVNGDVDEAFEMLSHLPARGEWRPGLRVMEVSENRIHRIGTQFVQVLGGGRSKVETIAVAPEGALRCFGERISEGTGIGEWTLVYRLRKADGQLLFRIEAHFPKAPLLKRPALHLLKKRIKLHVEESANRMRAIFV